MSEVLFQPRNLASSSAQPWSVLGASLHHEGLLAPDQPQGPACSRRATQPGLLATPRRDKPAGPALSRSPPRGLAERMVPAAPDSGGLTHQWPVQNARQQAIPAMTNYKAPAVVPALLWTLRTLPVIPV